MSLSLALAQIFSMFYVIVGLGILFNADYYRKMYAEILKNPAMLLLWGMFALLVGVFIILFHNYWIYSWETIITLLGWGALIEGVVILLSPVQVTNFTKGIFKNSGVIFVAGVFTLALGLVLGYFGFFI